MKITHISDLHYCPEYLEEVDCCVRYAVDEAIAAKCDACVLSGDLFDHRIELHEPAVAALLDAVHDLSKRMPVLILQGTFSHDAPGSLDVFKTLGGFYPVHVADRIQQVYLERDNVTEEVAFRSSLDRSKSGWCFEDIDFQCVLALFSCLPPVHKGQIAAATGIEGVAQAAGEYVHDLMRGWSVINKQAREANVPTIVVSHGTVNGSTTEHGVPMHGNDHEFSTGSLFASEASAIMLGHIHQHQVWQQDVPLRTIAYPGSPGRLHFGELTDKGFLIWDVDARSGDCEFIKTPAKQLIQIDFEGEPDIDALKAQAADSQDAHVRIRWNVDEERKDSIDKTAIEALFAGTAAEVKLEGRIKPIQRQRAAGISSANHLDDKLTAWADATGAGEQLDELLPRMHLLEHMEPEDVVDRLLIDHPTAASTEAAA